MTRIAQQVKKNKDIEYVEKKVLVKTKEIDHPMTNILPFGKCQTTNNPQVASATNANDGHLTPQPCIPNLPAPWAKVKKDVKVGSQAALLEGSKLTCAYGGGIEIVDPGQSILKE